MSQSFDPKKEVEAEGQLVIITARWILIIGALVLTLWNPGGVGDGLWKIQIQAGLLLAYAVVNFFLHAQYIRQGASLPQVAWLTSGVDLALISFVVLIQGQIESSVFVFYMPALLAISVAFPKRIAGVYALLVGAGYLFVSLTGYGAVVEGQIQEMVVRLLMMGSVVFVGGLFRHIEEQRLSGTAKPFSMMGGKARTQRSQSTAAAAAATEGGE